MENNQHLLRYEEALRETLLAQCSSKGFLDGELLDVEELAEKWREIAPQYMVDAVPEFNDYPAVAVAWAAYLGMGLAAMWDLSWEEHRDQKDLYTFIRDARGFDVMDEYVVEELLGLSLDSDDVNAIGDCLLGLAHSAIALMRNERVEPQTADAFYIFACTAKVFFHFGVSICLKRLGYAYRKVTIKTPEVLS